MAKKKTIKRTTKKTNSKSISIPFLKDDRYRYSIAIAILLFTIFLTFAFISFFVTGDVDQSKLHIAWFKLISDSDIIVKNYAGKTGLILANLFINKWFGLASFIFIGFFSVLALRLFHFKVVSLKKSSTFTILFVLWTSVFLGLLYRDVDIANSYILPGGKHGFYVARWLTAFAGSIGAGFILIISLFAILVFQFDNTINVFNKFISGFVEFLKSQKETINKETEVEDNDYTLIESKVAESQTQSQFSSEDVIDEIINKEDSQPDFVISTGVEEEILDDDKDDKKDIVDVVNELRNSNGDFDFEIDMPENEEVSPNIGKSLSENEVEQETLNNQEQEKEESLLNFEELEDFDPKADLSFYNLPKLEHLKQYQSDRNKEEIAVELNGKKNRIIETLKNYKIDIVKIKATVGPTVTLYEIVPAPGIRISKIKGLEDDIALSLSALGIRIIAPIPGKGTIGIEVPNSNPEIVSMHSIIASEKFQNTKHDLPVVLGKTISNEIFMFDVAKAPHLLVAGATGQGKSVGLNAIITSLLYKKHPSELKFVLIDPKKVELSIYSRIEKHFLAKLPNEEESIITDIHRVISTLNSLCIEMDNRYDLLKKAEVRNVKEYNAKFIKRKLNPNNGHRFLPYIVVVIDEFADLIMTAGKEIETPIARIAQLARAIGIHMIIATQRPSTNIITGVIKANFPTRIAFKVASMIDSRTILDSPGANQLIGRGDLLFSAGSELTRVQCAFVDTPEVDEITHGISNQQGYTSALLLPEYIGSFDEGGVSSEKDMGGAKDPLFEEAACMIVNSQQGSTSSIQRRFSIGYNRAGRIVDQLEAAGVVGPSEGSKARQVLVADEVSLERILNT